MSAVTPTAQHAPSARRHRMMHPWLSAETFAKIEAEAARRKLHPDVLAALVLEIVAHDNLFMAVIDTRD